MKLRVKPNNAFAALWWGTIITLTGEMSPVTGTDDGRWSVWLRDKDGHGPYYCTIRSLDEAFELDWSVFGEPT